MAVATLNLRRFVSTSDEFYELCQENPDLEMERINPETVVGDPVLPGFALNLKKVWG